MDDRCALGFLRINTSTCPAGLIGENAAYQNDQNKLTARFVTKADWFVSNSREISIAAHSFASSQKRTWPRFTKRCRDREPVSCSNRRKVSSGRERGMSFSMHRHKEYLSTAQRHPNTSGRVHQWQLAHVTMRRVSKATPFVPTYPRLHRLNVKQLINVTTPLAHNPLCAFAI